MSGTMDEQELRAALPWLVNGSLDAARSAQVRAGVEASPALQQEQAFLQRLRQAVRDDALDGPGELGWRRLRRQIDADVQAGQQQHRQQRWKGMAIAASVLVVAQLGWFVAVTPGDRGYEPMASAPAPSSGVVLQIRFRGTAPLAQVEALLQSQKLRIVDGPSAAGVWRVQLRAGDPVQVLQAVQAQRSLVEFAAQE